MQDINIKKINPRSKEELHQSQNIISKIYNEFLIEYYDKEKIDYLLLFESVSSIKEQIQLDEVDYFLIEFQKEYIGFLKILKEEKNAVITSFYILKEYQNKSIGKIALNKIKENYKNLKFEKLQINIDDEFKTSQEIIKKLDFTFLKSQFCYIGSDFFIHENVYELNLS